MTEFEEKRAFVHSLSAVLRSDRRSGVDSIDLANVNGMEVITITYIGGGFTKINANINSNGANATEIIKEVYGSGAFGRMSK